MSIERRETNVASHQESEPSLEVSLESLSLVGESAKSNDSVPGDLPPGNSECSPPAAGPHAENTHMSSNFLEDDDDGHHDDVEEDLVDDADADADADEDDDELEDQEEINRACEVLLPKLLNKLTPGGTGIVNKSTATLGPGSLFGRPTPAQLLLAGKADDADEEEDSEDDVSPPVWKRNEDSRLDKTVGRKNEGGDRQAEIQLGTVCFYDRATRRLSTRLPLVTKMPMLAPVVQVDEDQKLAFRQWLQMARTRTAILDDDKVVPGATSSSLL